MGTYSTLARMSRQVTPVSRRDMLPESNSVGHRLKARRS